MKLPEYLKRHWTVTLSGCLAVTWLVALVLWRVEAENTSRFEQLYHTLYWVIFAAALVVVGLWVEYMYQRRQQQMLRFRIAASVAVIFVWQFGVFVADVYYLLELRAWIATAGLVVLFFVGLAWTIYVLEEAAQFYETERRNRQAESEQPDEDVQQDETCWNPFDPAAWYLGKRSQRLNQSILGLVQYALVFLGAMMLLSRLQGCREIYEMPAGGGQDQAVQQVVRIQKIQRKKYIVNPFSAVLFKVPPIEEVKLELMKLTKHAYQIGQGEGEGAGFAGGTNRGKVRFIRLEYSGGDWDQDYGIGGDLNMLLKYFELTGQKIAERTESRRVAQLKSFPARKSPPLVYMTGQKNISFSKNEVEILREYLVDKHGMLFCDNGGSAHFHNQFVALMNRVLPGIRPVPIPLDEPIQQRPFQIPFLPYVAPHGGREALGWRLDGRWLCYYHPGDIGDAWADGNAGVKPEIYDACYKLGANVIYYAHAEYSKWLTAQNRDEEQ
jgi:hypothetical protein